MKAIVGGCSRIVEIGRIDKHRDVVGKLASCAGHTGGNYGCDRALRADEVFDLSRQHRSMGASARRLSWAASLRVGNCPGRFRCWGVHRSTFGSSRTGSEKIQAPPLCSRPLLSAMVACLILAVSASNAMAANSLRLAVRSVPTPVASKGSTLRAVSCISSRSCTAVGSFSRDGGVFALVERWNGLRWAIQRTPNPAGSRRSVLNGVSCTMMTCTAVGSIGSPYWPTLAERFEGGRWSIQPTAANGGFIGTEFTAVSCASKTDCLAVGSDLAIDAYCQLLVARWDGSDWSVLPAPCADIAVYGSPRRRVMRFAVGVRSCRKRASGDGADRSADGTMERHQLVGIGPSTGAVQLRARRRFVHNDHRMHSRRDRVPDTSPFVERLTGSRWSIQRFPNQHVSLNGVWCTSAATCIAVGAKQRNATSVLVRSNATPPPTTRLG
jgi:hypothetical protein